MFSRERRCRMALTKILIAFGKDDEDPRGKDDDED